MKDLKILKHLIEQRNNLNNLIDDLKKDIIEQGLFRKGQKIFNLNTEEFIEVKDCYVSDDLSINYKCLKNGIKEEYTEGELLNILHEYSRIIKYKYEVGQPVIYGGLRTVITKRFVKNNKPHYQLKYVGTVSEEDFIKYFDGRF